MNFFFFLCAALAALVVASPLSPAFAVVDDFEFVPPLPPCPLADDDVVTLTNRVASELIPRGFLEEALACCDAASARLRAGAPLGGVPRDVVEDILGGNRATLARVLRPYRAGVRRLLHGLPEVAEDTRGAPPRRLTPPVGLRAPPDPAIFVRDGALSGPQCAAVVALFERSRLFQGNLVSAGRVLVDRAHKNRMEFDISGNTSEPGGWRSPWAAVERSLVAALVGALAEYEAANPILRPLSSAFGDEGFRMIRYRDSSRVQADTDGSSSSSSGDHAAAPEFHRWHVDGGQEPPGAPIRILAAMVYLSEPEEGGETRFYNQRYDVRPTCGRVLIFPSSYTYVHAGAPVRKGLKYAVVLMITQ